MIPVLRPTLAVRRPTVVTLSGETVQAADGSGGPYDTTVSIRFNSDGTVEKASSTQGGALVFSQIDADTDWIIPNERASSEYDIRWTNHSGDGPFSSSPTVEDAWADLGSQRTYTWNETSGGTLSFTVTFEIGRGEVAEASATYTFSIENTS